MWLPQPASGTRADITRGAGKGPGFTVAPEPRVPRLESLLATGWSRYFGQVAP